MVLDSLSQILVGIYLGLLAGIFPAFIAFSIGFAFKYFTNVTVPGLGVVILGGALAGISGGLMGLIDPELSGNLTGITAILVILMASLWAHAQGDKLGAETPRKLTLRSLRQNKLTVDLAERVDTYGQIRLRPVGEISDIVGYPPLPDDIREQLRTASWKFPGTLSLAELEAQLEERLLDDYELAEVTVTIDRRGRADIAAAPNSAGLSRRIPEGKRAISVETLLPTGLGRGDTVQLRLPDGDVSGPLVSARTHDTAVAVRTSSGSSAADSVTTEKSENGEQTETPPTLPTTQPRRTTGGEGRVTLSLPPDAAKRVVESSFAPVVVHSRGSQPEYEVIGLLRAQGDRFRTVTLARESSLIGSTIGEAQALDPGRVAILALHRGRDRMVVPSSGTELHPDDRLVVAGKPAALRAFEEVCA